MKKPLFTVLLSLMLFLTACAPGQAPEVSPAPEPESPSSVSEPAPEPEAKPEPSQPEISEPEPEPEPSQPEPKSEPQPEEPDPIPESSAHRYGSYENVDTSDENWTAPPPALEDRDKMAIYLEETLTKEEYTSFYWREEGLGVLTPNVERVREVVAAYDGPAIDMEYHEVPISKARQDAAREAYWKLEKSLRDTSDPLIANSWVIGLPDDPNLGKIHIEIHQMHPALQEFLDTSGYGDCFVVTVTGADLPIVNPDT